MTKREFIQLIEKADDDAMIVIDQDNNGAYSIEGINIIIDKDGTETLSVVTDNEV